jgi:hypothetical protein
VPSGKELHPSDSNGCNWGVILVPQPVTQTNNIKSGPIATGILISGIFILSSAIEMNPLTSPSKND